MLRKRLPLHPHPRSEEALSSWIARLAAAYSMDTPRFLSAVFGRRYLNHELDFNPGMDFIRHLADRTGVPVWRVRAMSVSGYTPLLIDKLTPEQGYFSNYACQFGTLVTLSERISITPPGLNETTWLPWINAERLNDTRWACRQCLEEDDVKYYRLHWGLVWMSCCPRHGTQLLPIRHDINNASYVFEHEPSYPQDNALVSMDRLTLTAVKTGVVELPSGQSVSAGVWLRALRGLIDEICRPDNVLGISAIPIQKTWRAVQGIRSLPVIRVIEQMQPYKIRPIMCVAAEVLNLMFTGKLRPQWSVAQANKTLPIFRPPGVRLRSDQIPRSTLSETQQARLLRRALTAVRSNPQMADRIRQFFIHNQSQEQVQALDKALEARGFSKNIVSVHVEE